LGLGHFAFGLPSGAARRPRVLEQARYQRLACPGV